MFIGFFPPWLPKVIRRCVYKGNMAVSEHKLPVDGATSFGILLPGHANLGVGGVYFLHPEAK